MKKTFPLFAAALILAACSSEQKPASEPVVQQTTVTPVQQMPKFDESAASVSLVGFNGNDNVQRFIDFEAGNGRYNKAELQAFFNGVVYKPNIINIMNKPGTSRPWYEFQKGNAGAAKIADGRNFYMKNRQVIDQVAREYGVPAEVIVAIVGIETNYGRNMGSFRLADSLPRWLSIIRAVRTFSEKSCTNSC